VAPKTGLRRLIETEMLERHHVDAVGIERPDGPVVDALLAAGITVYVIPPSRVAERSSGHTWANISFPQLTPRIRTHV
jgi:hypothetical protein